MSLLANSNETEVTTDGTLTKGFLFASIKNIGDAPALVNNSTLEPGEAKSYPFVGKGYDEIPFQTNGSTLKIMEVL